MTLGLFIGRLNPPHIGHISIIEKALKENDMVFLLIGTNGLKDDKNPLSFREILDILGEKYANNFKLRIFELEDTPTDEEWINNIYEILWKYGEDQFYDINFYGGDFENDSAYNVLSQCEFSDYNFNYIEIPRKNSFVEYKGQKYEISATNLRKALMEGNLELAQKFCDKKMFELIKKYFLI